MASENQNGNSNCVKFDAKVMQDRADKLTDVLIETFGFTNTILILHESLYLTEQKQLSLITDSTTINTDTEKENEL